MTFLSKMIMLFVFSASGVAFASPYDLCSQQAAILAKSAYSEGAKEYNKIVNELHIPAKAQLTELLKALAQEKDFESMLKLTVAQPENFLPMLKARLKTNKAPWDKINTLLENNTGSLASYTDGYFNIKWDQKANSLIMQLCPVKQFKSSFQYPDVASTQWEGIKVCSYVLIHAKKINSEYQFSGHIMDNPKLVDLPADVAQEKTNPKRWREYKGITQVDGINISLSEEAYVAQTVEKKCGPAKITSSSKINTDERSSGKEVKVALATPPSSQKNKVSKQ